MTNIAEAVRAEVRRRLEDAHGGSLRAAAHAMVAAGVENVSYKRIHRTFGHTSNERPDKVDLQLVMSIIAYLQSIDADPKARAMDPFDYAAALQKKAVDNYG